MCPPKKTRSLRNHRLLGRSLTTSNVTRGHKNDLVLIATSMPPRFLIVDWLVFKL